MSTAISGNRLYGCTTKIISMMLILYLLKPQIYHLLKTTHLRQIVLTFNQLKYRVLYRSVEHEIPEISPCEISRTIMKLTNCGNQANSQSQTCNASESQLEK